MFARPHRLLAFLAITAALIAASATAPHQAYAQSPPPSAPTLTTTTPTALAEPFAPSDEWPFGRPHPDAPPEFAGYAFMIGVFDCRLLDRAFEGGAWVTSREGVATWRANYVMNGRAIFDEYRDEWGSTNVNVRTWDDDEKVWNVHWTAVDPTTGQIFQARRDGDRMVMDFERETPAGFTYVQRFAFGDITDHSYRWTNEAVDAEGGSVEIGYLDCTRR